jgi:hypothetical protein
MGETVPAPWQVWSPKNQDICRAALRVLCVGWGFLQAVHLEEVSAVSALTQLRPDVVGVRLR